MKKYKRNYLNYLYPHWGEDDFLLCEICLIKHGVSKRMVDIHHIQPKGLGGSKTKDGHENLIGVCRIHHDHCHENPPNKKISKDEQKRIHKAFAKRIKGNF